MIYQPAEDSYLLQKYVARFAKNKKVLDIGTGSGIQAGTAIKNGAKYVLAVDINNEAIELLKERIEKKGIKRLKAQISDLFSNINKKEKFDLIVINPPYLPRDKIEDKESALETTGGEHGYELIERFFLGAKEYLATPGKILVVFSSLTNTRKVKKIAENNGFKLKILGKEKFPFETLYVGFCSSGVSPTTNQK